MVKAVQLKINGMTCTACAQASERAVKKLPGIAEAAVNFATEKLSVRFEDGELSIDAIKAAVAKAGYEAVEEKARKEITIPIGGMTCASCVRAVERAVGKVEGVESVEVNFATEKGLVVYDPALVRVSAIKQAIAKAGYTPLAIDASDRGTHTGTPRPGRFAFSGRSSRYRPSSPCRCCIWRWGECSDCPCRRL